MSHAIEARRSLLYSPGSSPEMMEKATASDADQVALDLEDAVAADRKDRAREDVVAALNDFEWESPTVSVRINGLETRFAHQDVIALLEGAGADLDTILVPKVTTGEDVRWFDTLLGQLEDRFGLAEPIGLDLIIEETEGLQRVEEIASASPRVESLMFGTADFSASLGIVQPSSRPGYTSPYPGDLFHYARFRIGAAAKTNGLLALEGVLSDFRDLDGLRERCRRIKELGFDGFLAVHPAQVPVINDVFTPSDEDVEYAEAVLDALAEAERTGAGAASLDGVIIDSAHRRHAKGLLERVRAFGDRD